jgi:hypothetical protein
MTGSLQATPRLGHSAHPGEVGASVGTSWSLEPANSRADTSSEGDDLRAHFPAWRTEPGDRPTVGQATDETTQRSIPDLRRAANGKARGFQGRTGAIPNTIDVMPTFSQFRARLCGAKGTRTPAPLCRATSRNAPSNADSKVLPPAVQAPCVPAP